MRRNWVRIQSLRYAALQYLAIFQALDLGPDAMDNGASLCKENSYSTIVFENLFVNLTIFHIH